MKVETRILVVCDKSAVMKAVVDSLAAIGQGYDVVAAFSCKEASDAMKSGRPDLLIVDVMMDDCNVWELVAVFKMAPETADTPVVFISKGDDDVSHRMGGVAGSDSIRLPIDSLLLAKTVKNALGGVPGRVEKRGVIVADVFKLVAQAVSLAGLMLFALTFFTAYYNPTRMVVVEVNEVGEAELEYWIVFFMILSALTTLLLTYKDLVDVVYDRKTHRLLGTSDQNSKVSEQLLLSIAYIVGKLTSPSYSVFVMQKTLGELWGRHPVCRSFHVSRDEVAGGGLSVSVDEGVNGMDPRDVGDALNAIVRSIERLTPKYPLKAELWVYVRPYEERLRLMRISLGTKE
jgi:CheY-like chemotaxis protein